jgi:hypothetical protein
MKRTSILVFSVALICCFAIPGANAQTKKALRLGASSAVIGGLENGRSAQGADLTSDLATDTAEQKAKAKATVKERLKGYGLVVASDLGIDVVLEDVDGMTMAKLYGIGKDATAVAVKTDPVTKFKAVYSFDEESTGELKVSESDDKVEQGPAWKDRPEKERADIEKDARAKGLTQSDNITTKESGPKPQKTTPVKIRHTRAEISKMVDKALKEPMPEGGGQAHAGTCSPCKPPDFAYKAYRWYSHADYPLADGVTLSSDVAWDLKMFASNNPKYKRLQVFTAGGTGANAAPRAKANTGTQRYYYLRQWDTNLNPTNYYNGAAWNPLDKRVHAMNWEPRTAVRETSVQFTSGWSVEVGLSADGLSGGGTYSEQTTTTTTTKDFEERAWVDNTNVIHHSFVGSKPDYASLKNKTACDVTLKDVPYAAWDTFAPKVFGEWEVLNDDQGYTSLSLSGKATYGRVELPSRSYDWTGCLTSWTYRDWWYSINSDASTYPSSTWYVWWGAVSPGR